MQTTLGELKYTKYPIERNRIDNIWVDISFRDYFEAPVKEKMKIGNMKIEINTTEIMDVDILCENKMERKSIKEYFVELISWYVTIGFRICKI